MPNIVLRGSALDELRAIDRFPRGIRKKNKFFEKNSDKLEKKIDRKANLTELAEFVGIEFSEFLSKFYKYSNIGICSLDEIKKRFFKNDHEEEIDIDYDVVDEYTEPPDLVMFKIQLKEKILKFIDKIPLKKRNVIDFYYFRHLTMKEIGGIMNLTKSRVSQLHKAALMEIKKNCENAGII